MRKLMWFVIGFGSGCGLCAYVLERAWVLPACLIAAGIFLLSLLLRQDRWTRAVSMVLFGLMFSFGWFSLFYQGYLRDAAMLDSGIEEVTITATDYGYETGYGIGFSGECSLQGKTYRVLAYLNGEEVPTPGDTVRGSFRFRVTTGDGAKEATNHPGKGIYLLAYQRGDVQLQKGEPESLAAKAAVLRQTIKEIVSSAFPADTEGFARALLLGDTTGLSYELDTDMKVSGIRHVAAVSGLHISILFALITAMTFRKRFFTALGGIPVLILFAAIVGFTPSVVRACVMCGLMLLADLFRREYDGPTSLSFAVLCMLLVNPLAVTSVSLQLSVASVAGIFCFREPLQNWLDGFFKKKKGKLGRRFSSTVAISLSTMVFTTPLCAYYFGMVSLIGPITNLLVLWVISGIFYGCMAVCALYLLWQPAGLLLVTLIAWPIRYVLFMAKTMADIPLAAVYTSNIYIVFWLIFVYLLLAVFLLQKQKTPGIFGCCMAIGLCAAVMAGWLEPARDAVRLTVLDVGQGQSILLQTEGRNFLVDCGGDSDTKTADIVAGTLLSQGVSELDGIILTHYDRDHAGGLDPLLTRIPADVLLLPETADKRTFGPPEQKICYVEDAVEIALDHGKITVFGPVYNGSGNENSMCILFEGENCGILVTGDRAAFGERMLLRKTDLPDVDVLIAGHHGSKYSTSEELLRAVTPETVIISVGENNSYGHPATELLQRLSEFGCTVYRTDLHGTILFRR